MMAKIYNFQDYFELKRISKKVEALEYVSNICDQCLDYIEDKDKYFMLNNDDVVHYDCFINYVNELLEPELYTNEDEEEEE